MCSQKLINCYIVHYHAIGTLCTHFDNKHCHNSYVICFQATQFLENSVRKVFMDSNSSPFAACIVMLNYCEHHTLIIIKFRVINNSSGNKELYDIVQKGSQYL